MSASPDDPARGLCPHGRFTVPPTRAGGPLWPLRFAAKDLYDVQGQVTGAGSPDWLRTHAPATATAHAVQALLDAGATLIGKTLTDELAYSLSGHNPHYGTPLNTRAPGRFPGGSSSGSAAVVAAGSVDFALGTDTGGSNRIPASFCGLIGMRSTHGRISLQGAVPLMPSYDTVGWFTRELPLFEQVAAVLMDADAQPPAFTTLLWAEDALEVCDPGVRDTFQTRLAAWAPHFERVQPVRLSPQGLDAWRLAYRTHSAAESWQVHGEWIRRCNPNLSPAVRERFEFAASVDAEAAAAAWRCVTALRERMHTLLEGPTLLLMPTAPGPAPGLDASADAIDRFRVRAQHLTCIASAAGLPELSVPMGVVADAPIGLSLLAAPGRDRALISAARRHLLN